MVAMSTQTSRYLVRILTASSPAHFSCMSFEPARWSDGSDLPPALTEALAGARVGEYVGPVRGHGAWHMAIVDDIADAAATAS